MPTSRERQSYKSSLTGLAPVNVTNAIQTSSDNVKADFRTDSRTRYIAILTDLRYLAQYHDLQAVFDSLRQDLGLQ